MNKLLLPAIIAMLLVGCGEAKKEPQPTEQQTPTEQSMPTQSEPSSTNTAPNKQSAASQSSSSSTATAGTSTESSSSAATGSSPTPGASSSSATDGKIEADKQDDRSSEEVNRDTTGAAETGSRTTSPGESNH